MNKQMTLSMINDELAAAKTSKKEFLDKIERLIPWSKWIGIIKPIYYKGEVGNKPYDLELMLRIFILQNLYDLSDMKAKNAFFLRKLCKVILTKSEIYLRITEYKKNCLMKY